MPSRTDRDGMNVRKSKQSHLKSVDLLPNWDPLNGISRPSVIISSR